MTGARHRYETYTRVCRRCGKYFKTPYKIGKVCDKCRIPTGMNFHNRYINNMLGKK